MPWAGQARYLAPECPFGQGCGEAPLVLGHSRIPWEITRVVGGTHSLDVQPIAARVLIPIRAQRQMYEQTPDLDRRRRLQRLVLLPLHMGYDSSSPGEYGGRAHLQSSCARGLREPQLSDHSPDRCLISSTDARLNTIPSTKTLTPARLFPITTTQNPRPPPAK